jgi:hypothetical protein
MKITRIELHLIRVPFDMGAAPTAFAGMNLTSVDSLFVRVCTDAGVDGWGEGWGHVACPTTSAALTTLVGPAFIGGDVSDRSRLMTEMSHRFHIMDEWVRWCTHFPPTEQAKGVQFAWRPGPLIKRRSYCLQRHGCYWRLGEIPQQAIGGN